VARIPGATGIDVDPAGRYLAVASIERGVILVDLATGTLETLVPVGKGVVGPHGLQYDARGDLWVADPGGGVTRIDRSTGEPRLVAKIDTANVLPTARGVYVTVGGPDGGRVLLLRPDGTRRILVGTGESHATETASARPASASSPPAWRSRATARCSSPRPGRSLRSGA
jgi:DNA-binding beta-propeller fold protein YncE